LRRDDDAIAKGVLKSVVEKRRNEQWLKDNKLLGRKQKMNM